MVDGGPQVQAIALKFSQDARPVLSTVRLACFAQFALVLLKRDPHLSFPLKFSQDVTPVCQQCVSHSLPLSR